jgi:threonine dehydrogenase-like Zn-dependent dehydrogenase
MRALTFDQSLSFQPRYRDPQPGDGDTLIKVRQAGICATDLEITKGYMGFRGVLGHEFVGEVASSPDKALVGQRVVGEINVVCGRCDLCVAGLSSHCRNRSVLGILNRDGAFAEYVRLPSLNLHALPKTIDDDQAVFVEPLAAAFQVLKQIQLDGRKWVTVLGDGRLGLLVAQVLRNAGCPVRVIGKHADKLALCEKWQIRPRGTIVLKSTFAAGKPLNLAPLVIDEIQVIGSRCGPFREAIRALAEKQVDVVSLIHRRMKLEQGVEAMDLAGRPGVLKVILTID